MFSSRTQCIQVHFLSALKVSYQHKKPLQHKRTRLVDWRCKNPCVTRGVEWLRCWLQSEEWSWKILNVHTSFCHFSTFRWRMWEIHDFINLSGLTVLKSFRGEFLCHGHRSRSRGETENTPRTHTLLHTALLRFRRTGRAGWWRSSELGGQAALHSYDSAEQKKVQSDGTSAFFQTEKEREEEETGV